MCPRSDGSSASLVPIILVFGKVTGISGNLECRHSAKVKGKLGGKGTKSGKGQGICVVGDI